ncbi:Trp biosynthesis-associated membrane protein [Zhihengliuella sp.]|uniref:Trp biosynthesis-associated membrane protein n=1 Tax=Zhihengliuella sp. TaxID=1954483 RepID=UPI0028112D25|nr:Trp biosynthesis-associated membrane protein [Zhihengliuella sp.]
MTRRNVVLAGLLGGLAGLLTATRTWITVTPGAGAIIHEPVDVSGSDAATSVSALAIVVLAASVSATIAGRMARWIVAALLILAGVGMVLAAASVLGDPQAAAAAVVGEAAGTARIEADYRLSVWPAATIAAGGWTVLVGVALAVAGRRWKVGRRYARPAAGEPAARRGEGVADTRARLDEIDGWDRLSRGDDPTR